MKRFAVKTQLIKLSLFSVCLALSSVASVQANNALPDIGGNAFSTLTPDKEKQLGDVMMRQTKGQLPMVYDPLLDEYLNAMGNQMVAKAQDVKFPFRFYWVNDKNINAFATLGGNIVSHTGTLAVSDSESQFASVIAHEISHVTQRHIARSVEARSENGPLTLAGLLGSILLATVNPEAGMAGIMASQGLAQQSAINFTRSNEQEADRIGIQLMADAGYNPYAVPEFFNKLAEKSRFANTQLAFLYTHPLSQSRVADSRLRAEQFPKRFVADSQDYTLVKARVMARYHYQTKDAQSYFLRKLAEPGGNTKANQYGLALTYFDDKQIDKAEQIITKLRQQEPDNLYYIDAFTDILLAQGKAEQAMTMLEQQYLLKPNNQVITLNYANAAIQGKAYRLAVHLLRNLLYFKNDIFLAYEMLADTYKAMEDYARYYEARADLYYQLAVYPKAIDDLNEALNHVGPKNTLEIRRIEAKKKQWQAELNRLKRL